VSFYGGAGRPNTGPRDPKRPMNGTLAALLLLEGIAIALSVPVMITVSNVDPTPALIAVEQDPSGRGRDLGGRDTARKRRPASQTGRRSAGVPHNDRVRLPDAEAVSHAVRAGLPSSAPLHVRSALRASLDPTGRLVGFARWQRHRRICVTRLGN